MYFVKRSLTVFSFKLHVTIIISELGIIFLNARILWLLFARKYAQKSKDFPARTVIIEMQKIEKNIQHIQNLPTIPLLDVQKDSL